MKFLVTFMGTKPPVVFSEERWARKSWELTYSNMPEKISIFAKVEFESWEVFYGIEKVGEIERVESYLTPVHF